jgi:hypothetical protein
MNYELIIPYALWRDQALLAAIGRDLHLPALATLFGKGQRKPCLDYASLVAQRFALPQLHAAPIGLQLDCPSAEAGFWLRADPIHLRIDRDRLTVLGVPFFQINQQEADTLVAALNALFQEDGFLFIAPTPTRWYLRLPQDPNLTFTPLDDALGCNMHDCLPSGEGALKFHAVINEMQMVLYGNVVNDARDARGSPMINSVWLWGGGDYPLRDMPKRPAQALLGGDEIVHALQGETWSPAPASASELPPQDATVILDLLRFDCLYGNAYEWREAWQTLEKDWFAPLLASLQAGKIKQLTLTFSDTQQQVQIKKIDLLRFWRKAQLPF